MHSTFNLNGVGVVVYMSSNHNSYTTDLWMVKKIQQGMLKNISLCTLYSIDCILHCTVAEISKFVQKS